MPANLVVIDEVEILQCGDDVFFLDTSDFTDLTVGVGGKVKSPESIHLFPETPRTDRPYHKPPDGHLGSLDGDLWPLPALRLQPHQDLQDGLGPVTSVR